MATKLKDMKLTSVDLVRAGANQEADICLFKSADHIDTLEPTESPTEPEKNIFKRFIEWLRENPTEAGNEPQNPSEVGKADTFDELNAKEEDREKIWRYTSAIATSILSILDDESMVKEEKAKMMQKSVGEFDNAMSELLGRLLGVKIEKKRKLLWDIDDEENEWHPDLEDPEMGAAGEQATQYDEIEEVHKFNQNHDSSGRFAAAPGGSGGAAGGGAYKGGQPYLMTMNGSPHAIRNMIMYGEATEGDVRTVVGNARNPKELAEGLNKLPLYYKFDPKPYKETDKYVLLAGTKYNNTEPTMLFGVKKTPPSGPPVARKSARFDSVEHAEENN